MVDVGDDVGGRRRHDGSVLDEVIEGFSPKHLHVQEDHGLISSVRGRLADLIFFYHCWMAASFETRSVLVDHHTYVPVTF